MKRKPRDIITVIQNRQLLGGLFKNLESWAAWLVWLKATFSLAMDPSELDLFRRCTGREQPPINGATEIYTIVGRRGGKSRISAFVAVYIATFLDFRSYLSIGETGTVLILARDRDQARVVFGYIKGILEAVPVLRSMVTTWRSDEIELENGIVIAVKTSDYRAVRGITIVCCICDEVAFWDSQGVNPDKEVLQAIRPAMITIPGAKLLCISTGYAMGGVLYDMHKAYYGKETEDVLIWQADTLTMNPTISQQFIDREIQKDPEAGRAEWLGLFREDVSAAFPLEMIEGCVIPGRLELPPSTRHSYISFDDPSGGRSDSWTKAIAHLDRDDKIVIDCLRVWRAPFDPSEIAAESAEVGRLYGCSMTVGDNYAGEWPVAEFSKHSMTYERAEKSKSVLYLSLIPLLTSRQVELLDNQQLVTELRRLERRRGRSGKDVIDHPRNGHDDLANAVAGVVNLLSCENLGGSFDDLGVGGPTLPSLDSHFRGSSQPSNICDWEDEYAETFESYNQRKRAQSDDDDWF